MRAILSTYAGRMVRIIRLNERVFIMAKRVYGSVNEFLRESKTMLEKGFITDPRVKDTIDCVGGSKITVTANMLSDNLDNDQLFAEELSQLTEPTRIKVNPLVGRVQTFQEEGRSIAHRVYGTPLDLGNGDATGDDNAKKSKSKRKSKKEEPNAHGEGTPDANVSELTTAS